MKKLKPWNFEGYEDFELHVLTPKSGLWMLAWNLRYLVIKI